MTQITKLLYASEPLTLPFFVRSVEDYHKDTALSIAIAKRHVEVGVSIIAAGADKDHKNKFGWTPLMLAAGNGDKTTVEVRRRG